MQAKRLKSLTREHKTRHKLTDTPNPNRKTDKRKKQQKYIQTDGVINTITNQQKPQTKSTTKKNKKDKTNDQTKHNKHSPKLATLPLYSANTTSAAEKAKNESRGQVQQRTST